MKRVNKLAPQAAYVIVVGALIAMAGTDLNSFEEYNRFCEGCKIMAKLEQYESRK